MIQFLRIWKGSAKRVKCSRCKRPILLVIDDRGKYLPFKLEAGAVRDERTLRGTFQVFDPATAFHECSQKPRIPFGRRRQRAS